MKIGECMKYLYFDCFSGISGDMAIGALLDGGADFHFMENELKKLQIENEYKLVTEKVVKNGITSTKFDVILQAEVKGKEVHHHDDEHNDHHHHHHHGHHHHHHRGLKEITAMIQESELMDEVKTTACNIFQMIGKAEAKIHNVSVDQVHFHEVGAVDSIIDIVGFSILLHSLNIEKVICSPVPVGSGHIHIDHGTYPVPAPATMEILKDIPIQTSKLKGELTTPTGAGIVATTVAEFGPLPSMRIRSIGYGAGTKTFKNQPNVLRVVIGESF